jgi:phosphoserine phosphatase
VKRDKMVYYNKLTGDRIELFLVDGDGTVVSPEESELKSSWDMVGHLYVKKEIWDLDAVRWQKMMEDEKNPQEREKLYKKWVSRDAKQLRGKEATKAQEVLIPYTDGVVDFFRTVDGTVHKFLLSGGLNIIFERVAAELSFDDLLCNILHIDGNNRFSGDFNVRVNPFDKEQYLPRIIRGPEQLKYTAVFGDSSGDIPLFNRVRDAGGLAVAVNPRSDDVVQAADVKITDFRQLHEYITG